MNADAQREAVYDVPSGVLAVRDDLTPMLSQYTDLCEDHDDAVVLFQVDDFYEAFCGAARAATHTCEATLTQHEDFTGTQPMAGVPTDNATGYLECLLDAGYQVAPAEQVEDAEETSGLVDRVVTQFITPGTVVNEELLDAGWATYPGAVVRGGGNAETRGDDGDADTYDLTVVDVSTGECLVTGADRALVPEELKRLAPAELVVGPSCDFLDLPFDPIGTPFEPKVFDADAAHGALSAYAPRPDAVVESVVELRAVGVVLTCAECAQGDSQLAYVTRVMWFDPCEFLQFDATVIRSLELPKSRDARAGDTLSSVLDEMAYMPGHRRLEAWFRRPLVDRGRIEARLDAVEALFDDALTRADLQDHLSSVYGFERSVARVSRERADARDPCLLKTTLDRVLEVRNTLAGADPDLPSDLRNLLNGFKDVHDLVGDAVVSDLSQEITEDGAIADGFGAELDDVRGTTEAGHEQVSNLEVREQERTGIDSLEVGYSQIHGYYIEMTNPNLDRAPDDYQRRQTLKNSKRFYTPGPKERGDEILHTSDRADALEHNLFCEMRADTVIESARVQAVAGALADFDVLRTLVDVAVVNDCTRPEFHAGDMGENAGIRIDADRHPIIEHARDGSVPNPADLPRGSVALITDPSTSGKSTYMRQVAFVTLLAQAESFVPTKSARPPALDRVFIRIGASDGIAGNQPAFIHEMSELTEILHNAIGDSLILLDGVSHDISIADGLAIAHAATELLHDEVGATALFVARYHDLADAADDRAGVFSLHFTAARRDGEVTFLYSIASGPSSLFYGVGAVQLAGMPANVVERARTLVDEPETDTGAERVTNTGRDGVTVAANGESDETAEDGALAAYVDRLENGHRESENPSRATATAEATKPDPKLGAVIEALREADLVGTTPPEVLNLLSDLEGRLG